MQVLLKHYKTRPKIAKLATWATNMRIVVKSQYSSAPVLHFPVPCFQCRRAGRKWPYKILKHLTVESYTAIYALAVILIIINLPHSLFHSRLKTFIFCKSFPLQPLFFFFRTDYVIPQTFTVTSEHVRFYFLVFLSYTFQLSVPCGRLSLTHIGFRAHVKIASRIVSSPESAIVSL